VVGRQGADRISLNLTGDEAFGQDGADSISVNVTGGAVVTVSGGAGTDTITTNTAVTTLGGSLGLNDGDDLFSNSANVQLVGASVGGNKGNDTLNLGIGGMVNSVAGGGDNADSIAVTAGNLTNSTLFGGFGADTVTLGTITTTLTTIQAGRGHDIIQGTALTGDASLVVALGAGFDSINLGDAAFGSIIGGSGDDTISFVATALSGNVYGDGANAGAAGVGTGADTIGSTAVVGGTAGINVYGGGGADTISFGTLSGNSLLSGQNGADLIGTSALIVGALATAVTISGGAGQDTINLLQTTNSQDQVLGGDGQDSIRLLTAGDGSINGGSGNDTISYSAIGGIGTANAGLATLNGGAGTDRITFGTWTTVGGNASSLATAATAGGFGNVAGAGSGDTLFFAGTAYTAANWNANNQAYVMSAACTALTGASTANGALVLREAGNDLLIGFVVDATFSAFVNVVGGAGLLTTTIGGAATAGGLLVLNATNMGFTIAGDGNGVTISIT
jgi:hypothetical protein